MNFPLLLEIFGYIGTALVIVSMLMTSVVKLRVINICGSVISMIYAIVGNAWPIVLLNGALVVINGVQLVRVRRAQVIFRRVRAECKDKSVEYFLSLYEEDIKRYLPEACLDEGKEYEVHIAYLNSEAVGLLVGERRGEEMYIQIDYATPKYRDTSVSTFLFAELEREGVRALHATMGAPEHEKYLLRMGFSKTGEGMVKRLDGEGKEEQMDATP